MYERVQVVIFDCECTSGSLRHILEDYLKKLQETLPKSVRTLYPFVFVLFNVLIFVVSVCKFNKLYKPRHVFALQTLQTTTF